MRRHAAFIAIDTESGELLEEVTGTGTFHTPVTEPQTNTSKRRTHVRTS
jgi:type IV secretion system protein VirD4